MGESRVKALLARRRIAVLLASLALSACSSTSGHRSPDTGSRTPSGRAAGSITVATSSTDTAASAPAASRPSARPVTDADLLSAWIPSLRGNPAQHMVDGKMAHPYRGGAGSIRLTGGGAPAHGDFTGDGVPDAAVAVWAAAGAGGSEDYVHLYTNGNQSLGQFIPAQVAHREHGIVLAMVVRNQQIVIDWQAYDGAGFDMSYWSAQLSWDGHRIVVADLVPHTGATGSGLLSDPSLTISSTSLGALRVGMTPEQANAAAGITFRGGGDGATDVLNLPPGSAGIYVRGIFATGGGALSGQITCIGVQRLEGNHPDGDDGRGIPARSGCSGAQGRLRFPRPLRADASRRAGATSRLRGTAVGRGLGLPHRRHR